MKNLLTDVMLRKQQPTGKRFELSDSSVVGLRARVSANGSITFILKSKNAANKLKTITLGSYPELSLKDARTEATKARLGLKAGDDINGAKKLMRSSAAAPTQNITLGELVCEFEKRFAPAKKFWRPRGPRATKGGARLVIEGVYASLLDRDVTAIKVEEFAQVALCYKRVKPSKTKTTANGQVSRARGYLGPVLDWASGNKKYAKIGASRSPMLIVANLANTHDPATDDPTITGKRKRVLSEAELRAVLPFLTYPAPRIGRLVLAADLDYRPIAIRFLLYTAARLEEVCAMCWSEIDWENKVWHKPNVKSTKGGPRSQDLPLSEAAISILRALPQEKRSKLNDLVFPSGRRTGKLGNWGRYQTALHEATNTMDWHRHDLRRTSATIMHSLKVPASTIVQILAHKDPLKGENVGGAASNYLQLTRILQNTRDPQEEALATLAEALDLIQSSDRLKQQD